MNRSSRMLWPFPEEYNDPWYDAFESLVIASDASAYAAREDRNAVLMGGGTMSFNATTGVLSWSANIEVLSAIAGFRCLVPAGTLTLATGSIFYVVVTRHPSVDVTVTALQAMSVPATDDAFVVGIRNGNRVYFRNGLVLIDGQSGPLIQNGGPLPLVYSNTSRPLATTVTAGTQIWNTDDAAPNFSDGTDWRDALGNVT